MGAEEVELGNRFSQPFIPGETYIPAAQQILDPTDHSGLIETVMSGQYAGGPKTTAFQKLLKEMYFPLMHSAVLVNSGSSANLLAIAAAKEQAKMQPGDEIITLAASFPSTVAPIIQNGLKPVLVDIDEFTLAPFPFEWVESITPKTKAVIFAHTLGNPFDAGTIAELCKRYNLLFIEDCCDALGADTSSGRVGNFGDYSTLSFYPAHHISMGEGGAVMSKTARGTKILKSLRDWGRDCWCEPGKDNTCGKRFKWCFDGLPEGYDHKYVYSRLGYNLKATEFQASLGITQLHKSEKFITKRRENWFRLRLGIKGSKILDSCVCPVSIGYGIPSWFGFPMLVDHTVDRLKLLQFLESKKIGTRLVFAGDIRKQPAYRSYFSQEEMPGTKAVLEKAFWIGVHPGIDEPRIAYMIEQLEAGVKQCRK
jgi:CDP-6-deoxy-D-xylo-4-hexulose-3-dehydrase